MVTKDNLVEYLNANSSGKDSIDPHSRGYVIGIREIPNGFCLYKMNPKEYYKIEIIEKLRKNEIIGKEKDIDIIVDCMYSDGLRTGEYKSSERSLAGTEWFFLESEKIKEHLFLSRLIEPLKNKSENHRLHPSAKNSLEELGLDVSETLEWI